MISGSAKSAGEGIGFLGFLGGSAENLPAMSETWVGDLGSIPGLGRSPGEGNSYPLQCSGLENSTDCIEVTKELDTTERLSLSSHFIFGKIHVFCFLCISDIDLHDAKHTEGRRYDDPLCFCFSVSGVGGLKCKKSQKASSLGQCVIMVLLKWKNK